ncbi:hypothetical protein DNTS_031594 [Danionella cerebrum]|uniref:Hexosyltransferase n=1 Tax=Danionella cerebrum TaxID=2873325 RepID=A0A553QJJ1_9TELE|nr:hypothetical protein DNTS_031594 [Danionella translucida]
MYAGPATYLGLKVYEKPGTQPPLPVHFIAEGLRYSNEAAPQPEKSFWRSELESGALWNIIQYTMDRQNNHILNTFLDEDSLSSTDNKCSPNPEIHNGIFDFAKLPTQMKEFVRSMHCRDYEAVIDPLGVCPDHPQTNNLRAVLLLAIKTQTANFENREAIRKTWGQSGRVKSQGGHQNLVLRVFLLGKSQDLFDELKLQVESDKYGDIIQWNFMDTFFNLTLKDVLFWKWFSKQCPYAHFILKGDDDVFVRTPAVLDYLLAVEANQTSSDLMGRFVMGDVINNAKPIRLNNTKYFIPENFFKGFYPSYPGGGGVVYSGSLALKLLEVSQRVTLFPIDDVYLGMCLQRLGVYPIHHPAFLTFDFPEDEQREPCANHSIFLVHKRSPEEMFHLWDETVNPRAECRNTTLRDKARVP